MIFDSKILLELSTTSHDPAEDILKEDLAGLIQYFEPHMIGHFSWTPGHYNVPDPMTKDNRTTAALLLRTLQEGNHPRHADTYV